MLLKKSTAALCSNSGGVFSPFYPPSPLTSPCRSRGHTSESASRDPRLGRNRVRNFASVRDLGESNRSKDTAKDNLSPQWPASPNPTPYEIFDQPKNGAYCKARFYELVKLYHPDRRHHTSHDGIPHLTKLERYRLVVLANDILSDPERRRLYDRYGAGWGSQPDMRSSYRKADRTWRQEPGNPSMNATWEDWERWYQQRDGKKQEPVFVSNMAFVGIIALFVLIGGWGQATRAGNHSGKLVEMRDQRHESISKEMRRRVSEHAGLSKEDRIHSFLRQREAWAYDQPAGHAHASDKDGK